MGEADFKICVILNDLGNHNLCLCQKNESYGCTGERAGEGT